MNPYQFYFRSKSGKRSDIGDTYFRSAYEANYARFLNWQKTKWEYEVKTFWFEKIKRGTRSYTPDFWLPEEGVFHEVKGWMDPKSITRMDRMARYYPEVKVIIIGGDFFKDIEKKRLCLIVPGWECSHNKKRIIETEAAPSV